MLCLAAGCASAPSAPATAASTTPTARDVLPQIEHERIGYHIDRWTGEKRAEFAGYLANKAQYESMIREKLRRRGMPEDLMYLAMIESGFNVEAHSTAEATGIWQLVRRCRICRISTTASARGISPRRPTTPARTASAAS